MSNIRFKKDLFINDVCNDRYVLVVGSEVILDKEKFSSENGDVMQYILDTINIELGREEKPYKDLNTMVASRPPETTIEGELNGTDLIYKAIGYDAEKDDYNGFIDIDDMSPELDGLLRTRLFRMVMTTTFDDCVERLMYDIWGDRLRVVNIADTIDWNRFLREVKDSIDTTKPWETVYKYNRPTLIYIFGKARENMNFVKEEDDAIEFIERWMKSEDCFMDMIKKRRILALGCKFDDWYFRFFWYILKRDLKKLSNGEVAISLADGNEIDKNLKGFLSRKRIFHHPDARQFMREISNMLSPEGHTPESQAFHDILLSRRGSGEIFLSYCSRDFALASKLFFQLTDMGFNVWFDHEKLCGGDYNSEIKKAINEASAIITLLTDEVAKDLTNGDITHYYNEEWRIASQAGCERIIPVAANGYDLRATYHIKNNNANQITYENIIKGQVDGINLMVDDLEQLAKVTEKVIENVKNNRK